MVSQAIFCEINSCARGSLVRYLLGQVLVRGVVEEWFWDWDVKKQSLKKWPSSHYRHEGNRVMRLEHESAVFA
jgi:hypothetical protein